MIDFAALKACNAPLNAFVEWDERASKGEGPLAGLTIGIKTNIAVEGLHWTAGMALHRSRIAQRDAEVIALMRAAGAAIIGTVNMEEAALGAKTDNPWYGKTHNPHRIGFTPGGSSGGSGAAVAAGLCDVALGTDTMGSVRIPAAYCGVYGFKPAQRAVSQDGLEMTEASLDVIGPLARSLDVLEKAARIISQFGEASELASAPAMLAGLGGVACEPAVLTSYETAARMLGSSQMIALPHALSRVRFAGFIKTTKWLDEHLADADSALLSSHLKTLVSYGHDRLPDSWATDQNVLEETGAAIRAAVDKHGAILMPTAPQAAFSHSENVPANQADFTCLANIAGLPAISMPAGHDERGMPVAVQIVGRAGEETRLFAIARELDSRLNGYFRPGHFFQGD